MKQRAFVFVAAAIFVSAAWLGAMEARDQGVTAAENDYLDHLDAIEQWFHTVRTEGLSKALGKYEPDQQLPLMDTAFNNDAPFWERGRVFNVHPPLYKYLSILSRNVLRGWQWPDAERFPTALVFAGGCTAMFLALYRRRGWVAGIVGAAALASMPRLVSYAGFCTPDLYIAISWLWCALALERFGETGLRRWWGVAAAAFAFGLCSKLSMMPMLAPLGVLMLAWRYKKGLKAVVIGGASVGGILLVALLALIATYPFLWPAPITRLMTMFHEVSSWGDMVPFSAMFFGHVVPYPTLPWYFVPTIIGIVTPPLTLGLALLGGFWPKQRDKLWQTGVVIVGFWLILTLIPNTPKYDNERGFMAVFPFIALLAGLGASDIAERLKPKLAQDRQRLVAPLLGGLTAAVMLIELAGAHPFPMSYFSPVIGGAVGAAQLGFEPTYAMDILNRDVLAEFQADIPQGAGLTVRPNENYYMPFLQRRGLLRPDLKLSTKKGPYVILVYRHIELIEDLPGMKQHSKVLKTVVRDGVPLAQLWYMPPEFAPP